MTAWAVLQAAVPWLWLGAVLAISFLEAPLKFRAPGITVPLGVGIGRLVFRALNRVEGVLALLLVLATAAGDARSTAVWVLLAVALLLLVGKALVLRPRMDRRAEDVVTGARGDDARPSMGLHVWYVGLEVLTVLALAGLGVATLDRLLP